MKLAVGSCCSCRHFAEGCRPAEPCIKKYLRSGGNCCSSMPKILLKLDQKLSPSLFAALGDKYLVFCSELGWVNCL